MKKDLLCDEFQEKANEVLIRHKSILDILTKLEESNSRINRAAIKSVTSCGCISINAKKQEYNKESFSKSKDILKNHINGELCDTCREIIEDEIGDHIFYITSMCNALDLNLYDILLKQYRELDVLGTYSLL